MPTTDDATIEATTEIDAPPAEVWALVSDLRNMARWSPQCVRTFVRGSGQVEQGTRTINLNRRGLLFWPTQAKVVRFTPEREIAFRIKENWTIWSYSLEATPTGGTRLTGRREAPDGISGLSTKLTRTVLGGAETFASELADGIRQTLAKIKADAER